MKHTVSKIFLILAAIMMCTLIFDVPLAYADTEMDENPEQIDETVQVEQEQTQQDSSSPSVQQLVAPLSTSAYTYTLAIAKTDGTFTTVQTYDSFDTALTAMKEQSDIDSVVLQNGSTVVAMKRGMMVIMNDGDVVSMHNLTTYNSSDTDRYDISVRAYVPAFYYGTYSSAASDTTIAVKGAISGVLFKVYQRRMLLIPDAHMQYRATGSQANKAFNMDYYAIDDSGDLVHYLYYANAAGTKMTKASFTVDKAPSFMRKGVKYYSYDGVNFYTNYYDAPFEGDSYVGTYYPYFKYLSFRTQSNYTAAQLNSYMRENYPSSSIMIGNGASFINAQNTYGANALLELAFAHLESGRGTSTIATTKNNLFGISAYDSNPDAADKFSSVSECILYHAKKYINEGYADAYAYIDSSKGTSYYDVSDRDKGYISYYSGDWRYMGAFPGNKRAGVNVSYATDPYHGEKIGGIAYEIDKALGSKDYGAYTIALTNTATYGYAQASTSSWKLYKYSGRNYRDNYLTGMAVAILGESGNYYRVASEMPVNEDLRSCMTWSYNYGQSVAYVPKSALTVVRSSAHDSLDFAKAEELLALVEKVDSSLFTEASIKTMNEKRQALLDVMSDVSASQQDLDAAVEALQKAYDALSALTPAVPVSSITLDTGLNKTVDTLESFQIGYTVLPGDASVKQVKFTSSDETIAKVDSNGVVTPMKNGTVTITVSAIDGSGVNAVLTLLVDTPSVTSAVYTVDLSAGVLKNVPVSTTSTTFLQNISCPDTMTLTLTEAQGSVVSGEVIVKTGMQLKLYNASGKLVQDLEVSVLGDINGDGSMNIVDLTTLKSVLLERVTLRGAYLASADMNGDGSVSIVDFTVLKSRLLGL